MPGAQNSFSDDQTMQWEVKLEAANQTHVIASQCAHWRGNPHPPISGTTIGNLAAFFVVKQNEELRTFEFDVAFNSALQLLKSNIVEIAAFCRFFL